LIENHEDCLIENHEKSHVESIVQLMLCAQSMNNLKHVESLIKHLIKSLIESSIKSSLESLLERSVESSIESSLESSLKSLIESLVESSVVESSVEIDWSSSRVSNWHFELESRSSRVTYIFNSIQVELLIFSTWRNSTQLRIESIWLDSPRIWAWRQES